MLRKSIATVGAVAFASLLVGTGSAAAEGSHAVEGRWQPSVAVAGVNAESGAAAVPGHRFSAMSPTRVLDTRNADGVATTTPVGQGGVISFSLAGVIPTQANAVVLNVTATETTANTYVTAWANGLNQPNTSNLNIAAGETRPNSVTVLVGIDGKVNLFNHLGSTHLIADLAGFYFEPNGEIAVPGAALYNTTSPVRLLDTRNTGSVGHAGVVTVDFTGKVPADATSVNINLTGLNANLSTYVTAWPAGAVRPTASSLNLVPGKITPNNVTVRLSADKKVSFYNNSGKVDLLVDLAGSYAEAAGALFYPTLPGRAYDTRDDQIPVFADEQFDLYFPEAGSHKAFVTNVTGILPTANTFISVFPSGQSRPNVSVLNLAPKQISANAAIVGLGPYYHPDDNATYPAFQIYNLAGETDLVIDTFGYFE